MIAVVIGEGNSGGALALAVANRVLMLENAVYSILSPEGFASILWKDAARSGEACELMKLTAADLKAAGIVDGVIREPEGGAQADPRQMMERLDSCLQEHLEALSKESGGGLVQARRWKFRRMGSVRKETP